MSNYRRSARAANPGITPDSGGRVRTVPFPNATRAVSSNRDKLRALEQAEADLESSAVVSEKD